MKKALTAVTLAVAVLVSSLVVSPAPAAAAGPTYPKAAARADKVIRNVKAAKVGVRNVERFYTKAKFPELGDALTPVAMASWKVPGGTGAVFVFRSADDAKFIQWMLQDEPIRFCRKGRTLVGINKSVANWREKKICKVAFRR